MKETLKLYIFGFLYFLFYFFVCAPSLLYFIFFVLFFIFLLGGKIIALNCTVKTGLLPTVGSNSTYLVSGIAGVPCDGCTQKLLICSSKGCLTALRRYLKKVSSIRSFSASRSRIPTAIAVLTASSTARS